VLTEAHGLDQPVPWWSFTKTILAAAALVLVRDGRLALDRSSKVAPLLCANFSSISRAWQTTVASRPITKPWRRGDEPWPVSIIGPRRRPPLAL